MNCRGHKRRVDIIKNYNMTPIAHFPVFGKKTVHSDAGGDITDSYFRFQCVHKVTKHEEMICCGKPTAKDFCEMLNIELPRIFNPLMGKGNTGPAGVGGEPGEMRWNPRRKQLHNAIMLFVLWLKDRQNSVLFSVKSQVDQNTYQEPSLRQIKAINTLYRKYGLTARGILNELAKETAVRNYSFDLLLETLNQNHIEQYFED